MRAWARDRHPLSLLGPLVLCLLAFALSLDHLHTFPLVFEDEPWIAAAPSKLATVGIFGSDLFAGYYGMEQHHYQHLPLYHLGLAALFRLAGVGLFQMRFLAVACGLLLLALTFAVGRQVAGARVGLLAMGLLLTLRFVTWGDATGIPLLDLARISRYDIAVPLFGLAAFWHFNRAEREARAGGYLLAGLLVGLAGLSHLYGLFWLPALGLLLAARRGLALVRTPAPYLLVVGAALPWLPWLAYIVPHAADFWGQQRLVAERFDLGSPAFYVDNLRREPERYTLVLLRHPDGGWRLAQPGAWTVVLGLPLVLAWLLRRGGRRAALAVALLVQLLLFALLLKQKHYNYTIALWPLALLGLACAGADLWRRGPCWLRAALALLLLLIVAEGTRGIVHRHRVAAHTTPYHAYTARVAALIPPDARVLGLQHYWLGMPHLTYRTWLLPLFLSSADTHHAPLSLDAALEQVAPDVILLDRHMNAFLAEAADPASPYHAQFEQIQAFMTRHRATLRGTVESPDYGRMEVYWIAP